MAVRRKRYRSSITGRFVTAEYAARHPKTTQAETIRTDPTPKD